MTYFLNIDHRLGKVAIEVSVDHVNGQSSRVIEMRIESHRE
jgi:hypothetical protein